MSTMIERMARAIHAADAENWRYDFDLSMYEPQARAALTALLEPTEAMTAAIKKEVEETSLFSGHIEMAVDAYRASIQAALDEKEG